ncbi:HEL344Wp [Eremothecium sinecaudum]|uniref:HCL690Wp n=1 Tax=Eremothecium sinecaudum TaxID=45286 RepID=A0A109UVS5_9SACH|nr:HCL690Wp [Eremothecium sinecaudum]XP_017987933.1 HEL344Wp [Eremothecium sinecaudum]AMD19461.1 HCL690Wp [Eremothecium sinecaudum]AMD20937.1 HEL344Wp [Eremothecium sinecaudum]
MRNYFRATKESIPTAPGNGEAETLIVRLDEGRRRLGTLSAIGLICNKIVGTGIFVVTSNMYRLTGSVGLTLILWVIGATFAMAGLYVYMEYGTAMPRNGGEKNYLEFVFKRPKFFVTSLYAAHIVLHGSSVATSVFGAQMVLVALNAQITSWSMRGLAIAILFFLSVVNGVSVKTGLYIQNTLGSFKILIITVMSIIGFVALAGGIKNAAGTANFKNAFEGSGDVNIYEIVTALYNVFWAFAGYGSVNYALGEVQNPIRTLKIAGPLSLVLLTVLYMLVNIAYFAVIPKDVIRNSELQIAVDFFGIAFGFNARRFSAAIIALSAIGNMSSSVFMQARIIQQLGREGVLPFSNFFASSRPFNSPMVGLMENFIACTITIIIPPSGDVYNLMLNLGGYPMNIINTAISGGLLWTYWQHRKGRIHWNPPIKAGVVITTFFLVGSIYMVIAPYVPPSDGGNIYHSIPYWTHCVLAWGIFAIGGIYWCFWTRVLPRYGNYKLTYAEVLGEDGFWRNNIVKVYKDETRPAANYNSETNSNISTQGKGGSEEYIK